jgi:hypothetical protein
MAQQAWHCELQPIAHFAFGPWTVRVFREPEQLWPANQPLAAAFAQQWPFQQVSAPALTRSSTTIIIVISTCAYRDDGGILVRRLRLHLWFRNVQVLDVAAAKHNKSINVVGRRHFLGAISTAFAAVRAD